MRHLKASCIDPRFTFISTLALEMNQAIIDAEWDNDPRWDVIQSYRRELERLKEAQERGELMMPNF